MSYVKGSVEVNLAGSMEWQPAKKSVKLKKGDKVRTRSGSRCVVQFDDGSQLTIKSDSLVLIDDMTEDIRTRTKNSAIKLLVSDVEASILRPTAKGSRFIIDKGDCPLFSTKSPPAQLHRPMPVAWGQCVAASPFSALVRCVS